MSKEYSINWIQDDGSIICLGHRVSNNPKHLLFNEICKMIIMAPSCFSMTMDKIIDCIKTGATNREHYFAVIGDQALSVIQTNFKI